MKTKIYSPAMLVGTLITMFLMLGAPTTAAQTHNTAIPATNKGLTLYSDADFTVQNGIITLYKGLEAELIIPETINGQLITGIGNWAFRGNGRNNLVTVYIPNSVETIGERAFQSCANLTTVVMGDNVVSIGNDAFEYCLKLESINLPKSLRTIGEYAFADCIKLTEMNMPDNIETIGNNAFFNCEQLTAVTLGAGLQSLDERAFYKCSALTTLNSRNLTPPITGNEVFEGVDQSLVNLYVPETSADAYSAADTWQNFPNLFADIPVGHDTIHLDTIEVHDTTFVHDTTYTPVEVFDTTYTPVEIFDTSYLDTVIDTLHKDTTIYDTIIHKDSIAYDTLHKDTTIYDTIIHKDSIIYDDTIYKDSIIHKDSIVYDDTIHKDTILYHDTTIIVYHPTTKDTTIYNITTLDSVVYNITRYDSIVYNITTRDTVIIDTTLQPEIIITERIVEVHDTLYILIDPTSAIKQVVTDETYTYEATDGGTVIEGLTPGQPYAIYAITGALVVRDIASAAGIAYLPPLPPGSYILSHQSRWSKFVHK